MKKKYYSVTGLNGFGVYTDYYDALNQRYKLNHFNTKRFDSFEEAFNYAKDNYNDGQGLIYRYYGNCNKFKLNHIVFDNDCEKRNFFFSKDELERGVL